MKIHRLFCRNIRAALLFMLFVSSSFALGQTTRTIDLLILYDDYSETVFAGEVDIAMENWVSDVNRYFDDSNVNLHLNLVGLVYFDPQIIFAQQRLTFIRDSIDVQSLRDEYRADFVMQLSNLKQVLIDSSDEGIVQPGYRWGEESTDGNRHTEVLLDAEDQPTGMIKRWYDDGSSPCRILGGGQGYFYKGSGFCDDYEIVYSSGFSGLAFRATRFSSLAENGENAIQSLVDPTVSSTTLAHELAHNLGISHDDDVGGLVLSGRGYVVPGSFKTIVSNASEEMVTVFSSPELLCKGEPCGVQYQVDAVSAINRFISDFSEYRGAESLPITTDFASDLNNWTAGEKFTWTRDSNGTTSSNTGPSGAPSASSDNYYVYLETSRDYAFDSGDTAILQSPPFQNAVEVEFYYHMYGANIGQLDLQISSEGEWQSIWSQQGQQQTDEEDPWQRVAVDISAYPGENRLRFVATAAGGYRGDIALDEILVSSTPIVAPTPTPVPSGYKVCEFNDPSVGTTPGCVQSSINGGFGTEVFRVTKNAVYLLELEKRTVNNHCTLVGENSNYRALGDCHNYRVYKK